MEGNRWLSQGTSPSFGSSSSPLAFPVLTCPGDLVITLHSGGQGCEMLYRVTGQRASEYIPNYILSVYPYITRYMPWLAISSRAHSPQFLSYGPTGGSSR